MIVPARTATSPGWTSSPVRRTYAPDRTPRSTVTRDSPPSVHRSGSTASASVGIGAPVCTRAAWRGCRRLGVRAPASIEPITGRLISRSAAFAVAFGVVGVLVRPTPSTSTLRTAYPSMAA